ncbi:stimulated by retinoic acid gene 6 protein-like isoform X2 [Ictalurus furcatus]|uniref:stimulated by retinoic acid gene 6 protein-like isoform X2 n=1 Tax=Ictalurus furcatus TaxID=66913 RepID=UPI002350CD48|nr:stimulated by retinoic acid gene 6 protein-like isoform X2 [Ictalurus furcatus]
METNVENEMDSSETNDGEAINILAILFDSGNATGSHQYCHNFVELQVKLSLLPSVFIILLLSFKERRKKIHDCERHFRCLRGRFSFVIPLDFTGKMQNRWSYGFAFGSVTPFVIKLMSQTLLTAYVPPYLKALVALLAALMVSIACMPLFICLSTKHRLLGGVLGLLYSLSWFVAQLCNLIFCRILIPKGDNFQTFRLRSGWLFDAPQLLCLGFLVCRFGSIIVKGVQKRLRNHCEQEEFKENEYKYVQHLLRRSAKVPVEKSWFQRNMYKWDPYFKFPNRIIATVVLCFYALYTAVTFEMIYSWWLISPLLNTDLDYVKYTWYSSIACAMLTSVIHISQVLVCYRKHIKSLRAGDKKHLPKNYKLDPDYGVVGLLKYPGHQIAFTVWGYLISQLVMFALGLAFVFLVIIPISDKGFVRWLENTAKNLANFFTLLALMWLQRLLSHIFFLQDKTSPTDEVKPLALNNRKAFHNINYFFFFFNVILGIMSCLFRFIKSAAVCLIFLSRIERPIMPEGFEKQDLSYYTWLGMIMADHHHTNPVLLCFCHLLSKHTSESLQNEPLAKNRVHTRWLLMYTLVRNPKLILLRKKREHKNDNELAFAWAISNTA